MAANLTDRQKELLVVYGSAVLSCIVHYILFTLAKYLTKITPWNYDSELVKKVRWPTFFITPIAVVLGLSSFLTPNETELLTVRQIFTVLLIVAIAYLACNLIRLTSQLLIESNQLESDSDNVHAKVAQTQVHVFRRMCYGFVFVIAIACMFFTFPSAWQLGASLLASAGVLGVAIGIAAKPVLENTLASFIIALTRPILLDDEVLINDQYGRVESIRSTFIVVRTWDARRLIVPLNYVLTNIFENWSRTSPWKIGTVFLYVDPNVDVLKIRDIFLNEALPQSGDLWDGRVANLSVTSQMNDGLMELRLIASSKGAGTSFDLKAFIREYMLEEIRLRWPYSLARTRVEIVPTLVETDSAPSIVDDDASYYNDNSVSNNSASAGTKAHKDKNTTTPTPITGRIVYPGRAPEYSEDINTETKSNVEKSRQSNSSNDNLLKTPTPSLGRIAYPSRVPEYSEDISSASKLNADQYGQSISSSYRVHYDTRQPTALPPAIKDIKDPAFPIHPKATIARPTIMRRRTKGVIFQSPMATLFDTTIKRSLKDPNKVNYDPIESYEEHQPSSGLLNIHNSANPSIFTQNQDLNAPLTSRPSVLLTHKKPIDSSQSIQMRKVNTNASKRKESIVNASKWINELAPNSDSTTQMRHAEFANQSYHTRNYDTGVKNATNRFKATTSRNNAASQLNDSQASVHFPPNDASHLDYLNSNNDEAQHHDGL